MNATAGGGGAKKRSRDREGEWWRGMDEVNIACTGCGTRVQEKK
jgi:hypothetical protein